MSKKCCPACEISGIRETVGSLRMPPGRSAYWQKEDELIAKC